MQGTTSFFVPCQDQARTDNNRFKSDTPIPMNGMIQESKSNSLPDAVIHSTASETHPKAAVTIKLMLLKSVLIYAPP